MSDQLFKPCKSQVSQKVISNLFLMCYYHLYIVVHSYDHQPSLSFVITNTHYKSPKRSTKVFKMSLKESSSSVHH